MKIKSEGKTESERFDNAMTKILSVSHEEMQRRVSNDANCVKVWVWLIILLLGGDYSLVSLQFIADDIAVTNTASPIPALSDFMLTQNLLA